MSHATQIHSLFVHTHSIHRHHSACDIKLKSTMHFKNREKNNKKISREIGARYHNIWLTSNWIISYPTYKLLLLLLLLPLLVFLLHLFTAIDAHTWEKLRKLITNYLKMTLWKNHRFHRECDCVVVAAVKVNSKEWPYHQSNHAQIECNLNAEEVNIAHYFVCT